MKLSDFVIEYLCSRGSTQAFGMSGGAAVHLFDSADRNPAMNVVFVAHEQSAAMAADGFSRVSGRPGTCIATSGPGATNLLTGVCCSFYDSVPSIVLTGQVSTHRLKGDRPVRQVGFQETDVLSIYSSVTKWAYQLERAEDVAAALGRAFIEAQTGRPGPVLLDLPDDLQRSAVDPGTMAPFDPPAAPARASLDVTIHALLESLSTAKRPVLVVGGGLSTPREVHRLREFLAAVRIPLLQTWAGLDLVPADWPLRCGTFGVYGPRLGNFVIQHSDLIVVLGTRLSQNLTGGLLDKFAPDAKLIMVDVDRGELDKFDGRGIEVDEKICCDMHEFLTVANRLLATEPQQPDIEEWWSTIERWRRDLPDDVPARPGDDMGTIDAYHLVQALSDQLHEDELIFVDTGGNLTWTCNTLRVKPGQRVISAWNFTPMGYALPAAIGGATAAPGQPITVIIGDGGLQLCLGELQTVLRHDLPIRIILFNNQGHGIQKQTLETWLGGRYVGVDKASGLGLSDFGAVAKAMGFPLFRISRTSEVEARLRDVYATRGPVFCEVAIDPSQKLYPVLKFGSTLENQLPLLAPEKLAALLSK
jgi:acetolactate synthase-1/2/3 large subunit